MSHSWYSKYDSLIEKVCPDYYMGLDAVVNAIPLGAKNILELGCGTGNLTAKLSQKFPDARIVGIDQDASMIDFAQKKIQLHNNVELIIQDVFEIGIGGYDAVVSSLMFHLLEKEKRRRLLNNLYQSGSNCVEIFDRVKGETQNQENMFFGYFIRRLLDMDIPTDLYIDFIKESSSNNPMSLSEHRKICETNGYCFEIIYRTPHHGFIAYRSLRKYLKN